MKNNQKSPISDIIMSIVETLVLFVAFAFFLTSDIFVYETWHIILLAIGGGIWLIFNIASILRSAKRLKYQRSFNINLNQQEYDNE